MLKMFDSKFLARIIHSQNELNIFLFKLFILIVDSRTYSIHREVLYIHDIHDIHRQIEMNPYR